MLSYGLAAEIEKMAQKKGHSVAAYIREAMAWWTQVGGDMMDYDPSEVEGLENEPEIIWRVVPLTRADDARVKAYCNDMEGSEALEMGYAVSKHFREAEGRKAECGEY